MPKGGFRLPKPNHPNTRSKNMSIANYPITPNTDTGSPSFSWQPPPKSRNEKRC